MSVNGRPDAMLSVNQAADQRTPAPRESGPDRWARTIAYYDRNASSYAQSTTGIDTSNQLTKFTLLLGAGSKVLDAGCGAGRDLSRLTELGFDATGVDASVELARIAREASGRPVHVDDLRSLRFNDASFDGVWAMASLLHIERSELPDVLLSLKRLMVRGGVLFSSVKRGSGTVEDDTGRSFTLHDERSWEALLIGAGFDVLEVVGEPPSDGHSTGSVAPGWISSLARRP